MPVKTFSSGEVLTSADTNTYLNNGGLVYIGSGSGTTSGGVADVYNCFSNTYSMYRIVITARQTALVLGAVKMQLLAGATPSTANYVSRSLWANLLTVALTFQDSDNQNNSFSLGCPGETDPGSIASFDISNPFSSSNFTYVTGTFTGARAGVAYFMGPFGGVHTQFASYSGFRIVAGTGNMAYNYRVYGYRQA
jgi:hypothetical protein